MWHCYYCARFFLVLPLLQEAFVWVLILLRLLFDDHVILLLNYETPSSTSQTQHYGWHVSRLSWCKNLNTVQRICISTTTKTDCNPQTHASYMYLCNRPEELMTWCFAIEQCFPNWFSQRIKQANKAENNALLNLLQISISLRWCYLKQDRETQKTTLVLNMQ